MSSAPKTMKALLVQSLGTSAVQEIPVPTIAADEILVRNYAVAQNPTDIYYIDKVGNAGTIVGTDFSGVVVQTGSAVPAGTATVGDRVAGFTHGGTYTDRGAYAEYTKVSADLVWKVPDGTLSHEQAATMGCSFWTAAQALFHHARLGLVEPPQKVQEEKWIFIYGGSTSVGMFAIQLGHLAGYKVVTAASPRNWDLCKSLGADAVFDYRDPEVVSKIKEVTRGSLHHALDTISQASSQTLSINVMGPGNGKVIVILDAQPEAASLREDVKIQPTLIYTTLGRSFTLGVFFPESPDDRQHMAAFIKKVPDFVRTGAIKPNPVKLWDGGIAAVNDGLQYMREGKNSGEKIVYKFVNKS